MSLIRGKSFIPCKVLSEQHGFLASSEGYVYIILHPTAVPGIAVELPVASVHSAEVTAKPAGNLQSLLFVLWYTNLFIYISTLHSYILIFIKNKIIKYFTSFHVILTQGPC